MNYNRQINVTTDDYKFHEIVVYKEGGYFTKHMDTILKHDDENIDLLYNYTLLLIPPNDYKGGELIIYDKNNSEIVIECDKYEWKWVIFHKHIQHECKPILQGFKIIFKVHIALRTIQMEEKSTTKRNQGAEYTVNSNEEYGVNFEPMATGIPHMNSHLHGFGDHDLQSKS